ncbi:MAG TPA: dTMP kinase [bacterium]|nr:dTMP kinase [bacterium]
MRGLFITIEGPDGSGKTTQARLLSEYLRGAADVLYSREPGGTVVGEQIRRILLGDAAMSAQTEMLLFAASRAQFVSEIVDPALRAGRIVVSERFVDSSLAYQGYARGLGVDLVRMVNAVATQGLQPDLTLLLDIDPGVGLGRAQAAEGKEGQRGTGDRLEQEGIAFQQRVREGFLSIAQEEPHRVRVIDASRAQRAVHGDIVRIVDEFLRARGWRASSSS